MKYLVSLIVSGIAVVALGLGISSSVHAQTRVTLLTPDPIKADVDKIVQQFEAKTGDKVQVSYGTGVSTRKTVSQGGALDVTLLFAPFDEALSTAAAVKMALLNAKSIASVNPMQGSVGGAALLALDKMGITDKVKPKIKWFSGGGGVQDAVANGEIEIALGPYLSDMRNSGLDVVGALPPEAATPVDITGWLSTNVQDAKAAHALLDYLKSKDAAPVWEAAKVFPVQ